MILLLKSITKGFLYIVHGVIVHFFENVASPLFLYAHFITGLIDYVLFG